MRVAIYARRSTEEHQAASLDVQITEARRFAEARGWRVLDEHIYTDSGVSRAEFKKRPGLIALLNAATAGAFDVVVMRDESRLGGDMHRSGLLIQDLAESGVQLWYYSTGEQIRADDLTSRLIIAVRGFAAELEREKIAGRTREHLKHKAARGLNVGGRTYGYDNVETFNGPVREVQYRINDEQAAVIREIFRRWNDGESTREIARALNDERRPSPHAGRRGAGSWAPTSVLNVVRNERYLGRVVWGKRGSQYRGGTRVETRADEDQWTVVERPELAIIDAATFAQAQERKRGDRGGRHEVRIERHAAALLTGLMRCECGGPIVSRWTKSGRERIRGYGCSWAHDRGAAVCTRSSVRPATEIEGALLSWLEQHVLSDRVIDRVVARVRERFAEDAAPVTDERPAELARLRREIERLTRAVIETDDAPSALVAALADRERRARELARELDTAPVRTTNGRMPAIETIREWARSTRLVVRSAVREARAALASLLRSPIAVTIERPEGRPRWRLSGEWVLSLPPPGSTPGLSASLTGSVQTEGHEPPMIIPIPFSFVALAA